MIRSIPAPQHFIEQSRIEKIVAKVMKREITIALANLFYWKIKPSCPYYVFQWHLVTSTTLISLSTSKPNSPLTLGKEIKT